MPKSDNQKLKIFYILDYLEAYSNEKNPVRASDLISMLDRNHNIRCDRKTVYSDIAALQEYGVDIVSLPGKNGGYYIASRNFELPELKLLIDAVQSSRYLTEKKSKELIGKLEKLCSKYDAGQLQRQVYVSDRLKTENESIYYNVDGIHEAIQKDKQITFKYYEWDADKNMRFKKDGATYQVSPYLLVWNDSNYYLVAYHEEDAMMKHYRVDKMNNLKVTEHGRTGKKDYKAFSPSLYTKKSFQMFGGEETTVTLQCDENMAGVMIDRFGKQVAMRKMPNGKIHVRTDIMVSNPFFGWLAGMNGAVKVIAPEEVAVQAKEYLQSIIQKWDEN